MRRTQEFPPQAGAETRLRAATAGGPALSGGPAAPPPLTAVRSLPAAPGGRLRAALAAYGSRLDPGGPGLRVLLVAGLLAALIAGVHLWRSRPATEPLAPPAPAGGAPMPAAASSPEPVVSSSGPPVTPPAGSAATGPGAVVHVAGKVRRPGVVTLPPGARVHDAIAAAGGLRRGAQVGTLNLARKVVDGEQILVGVPGGAGGGSAPQAVPAAPDAAAGGLLDLNTATADQFEELPGVGEVLAARIVEYRDRHGGFRSVDQLREVTGIGERKFAELKDKVRV